MSHAVIIIDIDPDTGLVSQTKIVHLFNSPHYDLNLNEAKDYADYHAEHDDSPNRTYRVLNVLAMTEPETPEDHEW